MPRQPEGKLVAKARAYIIEQGGRPFKIQGTEDSFQEVGVPDILACYKGRFLGLEFKQPGEHPSKRQVFVLNSIRNAGGVAEVVTSIEEVKQILDELDTLDPAFLAWVAGFFDGEGSISFAKSGRPRVSISQKDRRPLDEIQATFGGTVTDRSHLRTGLGNTMGYMWRTNSIKEVKKFVELVGRYSRLEHRQVKLDQAHKWLVARREFHNRRLV